jgi:hypothetical protein
MNKETEEQRLIREWLECGNEVVKIKKVAPIVGGKPVRALSGMVGGSFAVARSFAAGRGSHS